ncbi:MAG: LysM peptidoglycan-binding domain-containing protein [Actinobacteria bacterium]|nr:LysM peptidoglycan-binding domain-containing protein [Actinomycetota bacterium]
MVANVTSAAHQVPSQAAVAADLPVHEVRPRDTLWGIAEDRLGDPFRWREIYDLNRDRPQPDGDRLRQPDLIQPGWRLFLPADAAGLPVVAARVGDGPETMVDQTPVTVLAGGESMTDVTGPGGPVVQQAGW